eukprot:GEZU01035732.1.p1 GENE.GEZU01035732.1~~GEZU01035732.1.p1  ORF type:complete len:236 (-),score=67.15 GEZU01035732.1:91-798(-)
MMDDSYSSGSSATGSYRHNNYSIYYDVLVKIILVGDSSVGKSCLLMRFADDVYEDSHIATIGVDFKVLTMTSPSTDKVVKMQAWDTAGQERFRNVIASYYRGAHGVILTYDVTNPDSFKHLPNWIEQVRMYAPANTPLVLVGNKSDVPSEKKFVPASMGREFAANLGIPFYECSAKTGKNVEEAFVAVVEEVMKCRNYIDSSHKKEGMVGIGHVIQQHQDKQPKKSFFKSFCSIL